MRSRPDGQIYCLIRHIKCYPFIGTRCRSSRRRRPYALRSSTHPRFEYKQAVGITPFLPPARPFSNDQFLRSPSPSQRSECTYSSFQDVFTHCNISTGLFVHDSASFLPLHGDRQPRGITSIHLSVTQSVEETCAAGCLRNIRPPVTMLALSWTRTRPCRGALAEA